jgi:hypothetical protein
MPVKRKRRSVLGVGIPTLVTILVVLLLAVFATLTLATARQDNSLTTRAATATQAYYAADSQATEWLAGLEAQAHSGGSVSSVLTSQGYAPTAAAGGGWLVQQSFTIDSTRHLLVTVAVDSNGTCSVTQWQTAANNEGE